MEKDVKIIIVAFIILFFGAVSFNFTDITGKAASDYTTITVSPKLVKAGETIHITVDPGLQGTYQEIEFYRAHNDLRVGGQIAKACKITTCFEEATVEYKLLDMWDNNAEWHYETISKDYYARVYDIYGGKWVRSYFTVERKYEAAGPAEHL